MTEEEQAPQPEPVEPEQIEDAASLKKALEEEKAVCAANLAGWQRAQADFVNYKRRCEQEREDTVKFACGQLVLDLLPVLDDLEVAFGALPDDEHDDDWNKGIRMIERKFRSTLEGYGLSPIKALGEPFDPNFHEAVAQGKGKEGIVVKEFQKGYKFRDRVIRPSKVMVGNGQPEVDEPASDEENGQPQG